MAHNALNSTTQSSTLTGDAFLSIVTNNDVSEMAKTGYFNSDDQSFSFFGVTFTNDLEIPALAFSIQFRSCSFRAVKFAKGEQQSMFFIDCNMQEEVYFQQVKSEFIRFSNCKITETLTIDGGDYDDFAVSGNTKNVRIQGGKFKKLRFYNSDKIRPQSVPATDVFGIEFDHVSGSIELENLNVCYFSIDGIIHTDTKLLLRKIHYNTFIVNSIFNNGRMRIIDLQPYATAEAPGYFGMLDSNLGKMDIFDVDFNLNDVISISNCFLIDSTFVNVRWPNHIIDYSIEPRDIDLLNIKETYRQLKYAYAKQGDAVLEHKFHALEMETYRNLLKLKRHSMKQKHRYKRWRTDRQTSIILWFSSWTSDYGQSFKAPLLTLVGAGTVLFAIMVPSGYIKGLKPGFHFDLTWPGISATIGQFVNFLNPVRRYDTQDVNLGLAIDLVMRIIASYCIYNFVRATRRFVK